MSSRTRLLAFEYVCGGGFGDGEPPAELLRQGRAMLGAVLAGSAAAAVYTLTDPRFADGLPGRVAAVPPGVPWRDAWRRELARCDAVLALAPEEDDRLAGLVEDARAAGRLSVNCEPAAVRLAGDKLAFSARLRAAGLPAAATAAWDPAQPAPWPDGVVKPRCGAGGEDAHRVGRNGRGPPALDPARAWVFEPWVGGRALSLSLLASADGLELLSCNAIACGASGGRLEVGEPEVGAADDWPGLRAAAAELLPALAAAVPGLRGYVGIDGVWDGRRLTVLELNPRLTLSYAGLAARLGPAALLERMLAAAGTVG